MIAVLNDFPHAKMHLRTIAEMGKRRFKVALTDGATLYLSPAQRKLYDLETGNDRRNFLLSTPIVTFRGEIGKYLSMADEYGRIK